LNCAAAKRTEKNLHEQYYAYLLACREAALYAAGQMGWHVVPCSDERHQPYAVEVLQQQIWELVRK
jgi:dTMP kinase